MIVSLHPFEVHMNPYVPIESSAEMAVLAEVGLAIVATERLEGRADQTPVPTAAIVTGAL
jgi:hypothetical protein